MPIVFLQPGETRPIRRLSGPPALRRRLQDRARIGRREIWLALSWDESQWRDTLECVLEDLAEWWSSREGVPSTSST